MTEASENGWLVRVRAQVMYRDETAEGWVPTHGGGGLAHVMIGRRDRLPAACENDAVSAPQPPHEFFILGRRISDNSVVLECTIKKDFQYNKVMPTFHHWVTDEKRFGLTFQTAADARAFDKGVRTAVEELLDGLGGAWPALHTYKKPNAGPKEEDEEQNIFECLNLPSDSRSSSETSTASRPGRGHGAHAQTPILSAITLPAHHAESIKSYEVHIIDKLDGPDGDRCPYVHLSAVHEYVYPSVGSEKNSPNTKPPLLKRDSGSIKKSHQHSYSSSPPPLPDKKPADAFQTRLRCKYCNELYLASLNRAGACSAAPDGFRACLERATCLRAAQGMLYHCMARDEDGDFVMHPCACQPVDDNCIKRWLGIALLSLVVPCLWCYLPLRCIHRCARAAGCVSACHQPTTPPPNPNK